MKTIGILGGVGSEATAELFKRIVLRTPVTKDQEHIPLIIINNPSIPDRTKAILKQGESPVSEMIKTAKKLEANNVDFILIPCNTAHHFIKKVQKEINIPIINMVKETAKFIKHSYPTIKKVGLLATTGTIESKIYHKEFISQGIEIIAPDETIQNTTVMNAIYGPGGIKTGDHEKPREKLEQVGKLLSGQGADLILAGCTEVSLVLKQKNVPYVIIDPLTILAETAIAKAINLNLPLRIQTIENIKETSQVKN